MGNQNNQVMIKPIDKMKSIVNSVSVQEQFKNALGKHSDLFTASIISLYSNDSYLQNCDPSAVVKEALKAAVLKLPIEKNLGFAYIIPYKRKFKADGKWQSVQEPQLQMGYKGRIQLAMRTGQIKTINDGAIYEGETVIVNRITGEIKLSGEPKSNNAIGYFGYFELTNGYKKVEYWTKEEVIAHAKKYSQSYKPDSGVWFKEFDKMASKTVLSHILDKYAPKSIEFLLIEKQQESETEQIENDDIVVLDPEKIFDAPEDKTEPETTTSEDDKEWE